MHRNRLGTTAVGQTESEAPLHSRNPNQASTQLTSGASASRRRPTAEDWHRTVVALPNTSLPTPAPQPAPPAPQPAPPQGEEPNSSGLPRWRISIFGYWISVFVIAPVFFVAVFAQEELFGLWILCQTAAYLTVAALRARDMGKPWWACFATLIPYIGVVFFLRFGLTPSEYPSTAQKDPKRQIIIGAIVGAASLATITVAFPLILILWNAVTSDGQADLRRLTYCDTRLREYLRLHTVTPDTNTANAAIEKIQINSPDQCPPGAWNPVVNKLDRDQLGNIDVAFSTTTASLRANAVTAPADGQQRWIYVAKDDQWYSAQLSDPSVLVSKPTAIPRQQPNPVVTPPVQSLLTKLPEPTREYRPTAPSSPTRPAINPIPSTTLTIPWALPTSRGLETVVPPTLEISNTLGFTMLTVTGQVKNTTGRRMANIMADCQIYDGDVQVASAFAFTTSLAPNAKWQYQADLFADDLHGSNYHIECLFQEW